HQLRTKSNGKRKSAAGAGYEALAVSDCTVRLNRIRNFRPGACRFFAWQVTAVAALVARFGPQKNMQVPRTNISKSRHSKERFARYMCINNPGRHSHETNSIIILRSMKCLG